VLGASLNASVRLPIVVPIRQGRARIGSAMSCSLRFRGPAVAVRSIWPRGVQTIAVNMSSGPGAGCVNHSRSSGHKVPRSRSRSSRQLRGLACSFVSSGLSVRLGGVCRCLGGRVHSSLRSQPGASFDDAVGARVRSAEEPRLLSQSFTRGSLTTRSSGPGLPSSRARIGRACQYEAPTARLRRRVPAAQRER
jgi:hypothetical protein